MKIHKTLLLMTAICLPCCFLFFYLLDRNSPENDRGLYLALGWIGYLGMLTFIIPRDYLRRDEKGMVQQAICCWDIIDIVGECVRGHCCGLCSI